MKKSTIISMLLGVAVFGLLVFLVFNRFNVDQSWNEEVSGTGRSEGIVMLSLSSSDDTDGVIRKLYDAGVITNRGWFRDFLSDTNQQLRTANAEFEIATNLSYNAIIETLRQNATVSVTIPEGFENRQIIDRLVDEFGIGTRERFEDVIANHEFDFDFVRSLPLGADRLEGYLFPDTYVFYGNESEENVIARMLGVFDMRTQEIRENLTGDLDFHEVVILASIIERESGIEGEASIVSSVFRNRLREGMRLESCATVVYFLQIRDQFQEQRYLTYEQIQVEHPYNTYLHAGLPPGAIANPGLASLEGAANPAETGYFFFVWNAAQGRHIFSRTLAEHEAASAIAFG